MNFKGHEPLVRILVIAYSVIIGLILFLVLNAGNVLDDTLSKILVGILCLAILSVLIFLLAWKGPEPVAAEGTVKVTTPQKSEKDKKKKRR